MKQRRHSHCQGNTGSRNGEGEILWFLPSSCPPASLPSVLPIGKLQQETSRKGSLGNAVFPVIHSRAGNVWNEVHLPSSFISCVISGKLLFLSEPPIPHVEKRIKCAYFLAWCETEHFMLGCHIVHVVHAVHVNCDYIIHIIRECGSQSRVTQHRKSRAGSPFHTGKRHRGSD